MARTARGIDKKLEILKETRLFGILEDEDLEPLAEQGRIISLDAGDFLFSAGERASGLFVVIQGKTKAIRHGADGREQIIHEDERGATFPEVAVFDDGPYPSSVVGTEKGELLFLPKAAVRRFCLHHPEVALAALEILSQRLRRATGMVEGFALRDVTQRLADFLHAEFAGQGCLEKGATIEISHTNQEIADSIGTVREVVSRSFSKLQRRGWIRKKGREVTLLDSEALGEFAEMGDL